MACGGWGTSSISSGDTSRSNSSSNVSVGGAASVSNFGGGLGPLGGGLGPLGGGLGPIGGGLGGTNSLEMRLRAGIEADRQCQAENCAKLKAVHTAATYEDFRQMVMGEVLVAQYFLSASLLWVF
ncbi:Dynein attachment factor N-terminal [Trinorchestia longiramus]|nr:Dynein attachment factor N-terminal [Trinorchestia longiramus]